MATEAQKKAMAHARAAKAKKHRKKKQGYNARLDESLGMRHRGKHKQSLKDRRDESKGEHKAVGRPAYSGTSTSRQGHLKKG